MFYKRKCSNKWAQQSPDKNTKNETDYFLVSDLSIVKDGSLRRIFHFLSDHRAIQLKPEILKRIRIKNWVKHNNNKLDLEVPSNTMAELKIKFNETIQKENLTNIMDIQDCYDT